MTNDGPFHRVPPEAIQPLRDHLSRLRGKLTELSSRPDRIASDEVGLTLSIAETEALIKRLENPNVPRHP